jgi:hypothetical protein
MSDISLDIAAYEKERPNLEQQYMLKWVLFRDQVQVGIYNSFQEVAQDAVSKFGRGPYLIRQIGVNNFTLPASVMFKPVYA